MKKNSTPMKTTSEREAQWTAIWDWNKEHGFDSMDSQRYDRLKQRRKPNRVERREQQKKDQPHKRKVPFGWAC